MKFKKFVCGMLSAAMLLSVTAVSALTFDDVENDSTVEWAKPYIHSMTDAGYIKGFEDGTFRPNQPITKIQSLLLMSRMIGVDDAAYSDIAENAVKMYESTLSGFNTDYKKEVSYLLYCGVIKETDLNTYVSSNVANNALKRYEAAILLTKMLGKATDVANQAFVSSSYSDSAEIPSSARAYVEYVREQGIMQGMGNDASGAPVFSPNTEVTRAQMAKMLACLIDLLNTNCAEGIVKEVNSFDNNVTLDSNVTHQFTDDTLIHLDGAEADLSAIEAGKAAKILYANGLARTAEFGDAKAAVEQNTTIYGIISNASENSNGKQLTLKDYESGEVIGAYYAADDCEITVSGGAATFNQLKINDYVKVTLENGVITSIVSTDKTTTVTGKLENVEIGDNDVTLVLVNSKGEESRYTTSANGVSVERNDSASDIQSLAIGDGLTLRLTYGKITKIQASSVNQSDSGTIESILLSSSAPQMTVTSNGKKNTYNISRSVKVTVDGKEGSLYDLRPGLAVSYKLESQEIVELSTSAAAVSSKEYIIGTIQSINTTYGFITVEDGDGNVEQVFTNSGTAISDDRQSVSKNISIKALEVGMSVIATGSNSTGVFTAKKIIVQ